jgi:alanyl-tRNA synthetase
LDKVEGVIKESETDKKEISKLHQSIALEAFTNEFEQVDIIDGVVVFAQTIDNADIEILRSMTDKFKEKYNTGVVVLGSIVNDKPIIIAAVTDDLVKRGLHAGQIVKHVAEIVGGGGGGRPTLAQAGGKDAKKLPEAIQSVLPYVKTNLK